MEIKRMTKKVNMRIGMKIKEILYKRVEYEHPQVFVFGGSIITKTYWKLKTSSKIIGIILLIVIINIIINLI